MTGRCRSMISDNLQLDYSEIRSFIKSHMRMAYNNPNQEAGEARILASLASGIDTLLMDMQEGRGQSAVAEFLGRLNRLVQESRQKKMRGSRQPADPGARFFTDDGRAVYLGTILGSGGEGYVYRIQGMPGKAAKIYSPGRYGTEEQLQKKERHIRALIRSRIPSRLEDVLVCTIPESCLYRDEEAKEFVGFLMPEAESPFKFYDVLRETAERNRFFPDLDYRGMIAVAYNLAEAVDYLHGHGVVVGDMNYSNIAVNTDGTVCLTDADSFDVRDRTTGEHFCCEVGMAELLAPELQRAGQTEKLQGEGFTEKTDDFSLAVNIFRLLMNNAAPFQGASGTEEVHFPAVSASPSAPASPDASSADICADRAVAEGWCPYVKETPGERIPHWAPDYNMLPRKIRELFGRAFDYTAENYRSRIALRPTAREWMEALMEFYRTPMKQCGENPFHWFRSELEACPFCNGAPQESGEQEKAGGGRYGRSKRESLTLQAGV